MPLRAFVDSDNWILSIGGKKWNVLMPLRAFVDSDEFKTKNNGDAIYNVLMPLRAFVDSDKMITYQARSLR